MIYFVTGNKDKFGEVKAVLPEIEQLEVDLPEIQELDPYKIVEAKLNEAGKHQAGEFIVEDSSLCLSALGGLPGPLVKWFENSIGNEGIFQLAEKFGNFKAEAKDLIGYLDVNGEVHFFEGIVKGTLTKPTRKDAFGWDSIFIPKGSEISYAEMTKEEKNKISHRFKALEKFKKYLENN